MATRSCASFLVVELTTARLRLRDWRVEDREPFAALNADPVVMEYFTSTLTRDESDALVDRIEDHFAEHGYGLWAAEIAATGEFIGFIGLCWQTYAAHFTPALEVGWRLAHAAWGHGYAPEGAKAALECGFGDVGVSEIVSTTTVANRRSQRVMEKIGLRHDPADDFDHPNVPAGHPIRKHVLYRIDRARWSSR